MTINRQSVLLIIMFLFVVGGGFYYFFTIPLHKEAEQYQQLLQQERTLLSKLQEASGVKKEKKSIVFPPGYQASIPEAPYLELLMLDMTRLETISGVDMEGIGLSDQEKENETTEETTAPKEVTLTPIGTDQNKEAKAYPGVYSVSVSTKIKGTYEQVYRFFTELSALPRMMRVESVKISGGGGNGTFIYFRPPYDENKQINVEVTLSAFYVPVLQPYFKQELPIIVPPPAERNNPFY